MNILHVTNMYPSRDRPYYGIFVQRQIESLRKKGLRCEVACVGKGFGGYREIFNLKERVGRAEIIHCHFGHTGSLALFWKAVKHKPVVVSYCGDDLLGRVDQGGGYSKKHGLFAFINSFLSRYVDYAVVQSGQLSEKVRSGRTDIIPYGTDTDSFCELNKSEAKERIGLKGYTGKLILFLGQKEVPVKNYRLLEDAFGYLDLEFECRTLGNIAQEDMIYLMNAADVCVLTSKHEGSPNVVREAMACNKPIVSVNVGNGEVEELLGPVEGCYVTGYDPEELAGAIKKALNFERTEARNRLLELKLDLEGTSERIIKVYKETLG